MARELTLPKLGENIDTAVVIEVLVKPGDSVGVDQPLLSLETDKAEFELPSTIAGKVAEILVKEGDEVKMGQALLRIDEGGDGAGKSTPASVEQQTPQPQESRQAGSSSDRQQQRSPKGEAEEVQAEGAAESAQAPPAAPDSPPPAEQPSQRRQASGGSANRQRAQPDHDDEDADAAAPPPAAEPARSAAPSPASAGPVPAAPSVRRMARELGVDISRVSGSGAGGRISERDVQRHARALLRPEPASAPVPASATAQAPDGTRDAFGAIEREPVGRIRMRIAERMTEGWTTIPHVTHHDAADVTELERLREQYGSRASRGGGKLTMTAILLKTLGSALRKFPKFNASLELEEGQILYHRYVNVAVAVDTDRGLVAPVIRNVDEKNIMEIARALGEIAERARGRALTPELLEGATFTLSNLGGIGGSHFSPIISPPQVAVLGVGRSQMEPRWVVDRFEPRRILPLSLSYDHRLIDGADAARFSRWLCEALEEPFVMDLEGN
ncbi:MAG TPA: 2-oxo acid dehydrogenase subunit E2 [Candidatus Binatia bacterium]|nr:2-oxo acid dehydrogenase subunit E2 [Candidatus Binatia bacterium]